MKHRIHRLLALALCAVMALGCFSSSVPAAGAAQLQQGAEIQQDQLIYAKAGEATFVPAGYTYVYEAENGSTYTKTVPSDAYVTFEALSPKEAEALATLDMGDEAYLTSPEGDTMVSRSFDAKEAAALSNAVKEILGEQTIEEGQQLQVVSPAYTAETEVRVMITFEDNAVIRQPKMNVALGETLGAAETQAARTLEQKQNVALASMERKLGHSIEVGSQFTLLTNAAAVTVPYGELAEIRKMEGVKSAYVMPTFEVPEINAQEVTTLEPNMKYVAPGMGATSAWDYGFDGAGMSVAIIDSGLYYSNPVFDINPTDESAVAFTKADIQEILANHELHAETLAEGVTADNTYYSSKIPFGFGYGDATADFGSDNAGVAHGTHVAGIVAGNMPEEAKKTFKMDTMGLAPEAQLLVMNVSDRQGGIYFDAILAAMEDCIILGVDCANLSLGSPCGPAYVEGMSEVFDAAYEAGISVAVSAGNSYFSGWGSLWGDNMVKSTSVDTGTVGMPGSFDAPLTVASAENAAIFYTNGYALSYMTQYGYETYINYSELAGVPEGKGFREQLGDREFEFTKDPADAEGKLLFSPVSEDVDPVELVNQAMEAKAAGLILVNGSQVTLTEFPLPIASLMALYFNIMERDIQGNIRVEGFWNRSETAGQMSDFSSWGPTGSLTLKPEITGVGGNVLSAYGDGMGIASGTSMSSPAVAASAALVRQYLKDTDIPREDYAHVTNCLLMSTATPILDEENGTLYFVRRQGAGMVNIGAAMDAEAYIQVEGTNKAKLELGDDPERTGVYEMTFEVVNFSDSDKTYTLDTTVLGQKAVGGLMKYGQVTHLTYEYARELDTDITYSAADGKVTVPAGETVKVTATVALTEGEKEYYDERFPCGAYVEGFVHLNSEDDVNLSIPFLGFYGDFTDAPTLETGSYVSLMEKYPYTTADQVHTALWGMLPTNLDLEKGGLANSPQVPHYLGDTRNTSVSKIPAEYESHENAVAGYHAFQPVTAGVSPNGDHSLDDLNFTVGLTRNAANIHYTVTDRATGEILWEEDTGYISKTYSQLTYFAPTLEWLYPIYGIDQTTGNYVYDINNCLLEENTWVTMRLEITPEDPDGEVVVREFPLYIDCTGPFNKDDFTVRYQFSNYFKAWQGEYFKYISEDWFYDYCEDYVLEYAPDEGGWLGGCFVYTYMEEALRTPGWHKSRNECEAGTFTFTSEKQRFISTSFDYAGNVSAVVVESGDGFRDYVDLTADATAIQVGETLTVRNLAEAEHFTPILRWTVSDPTVAEIVESDQDFCTIRGIAHGAVTVTGDLYGRGESFEIQVTDPAFAEFEDKFVDISGHWAEDEILNATYRGWFRGMDATHFVPNESTTRAMMVTTLYRLAGSPEVTEKSSFTDVPENAWYTDAVAWAVQNGVTEGTSEETFSPHEKVTREQAATFLYRYATNVLGFWFTLEGDLSGYTDEDRISEFAAEAILWATDAGIFQGFPDGTFQPQGALTRAQLAKILTVLNRYAASYSPR